jgi:hypothetical protein
VNAPRSERHHHDHRHEVRASTSPAACPSQAGTEWACSVERRPEFSSFSELSFTASPLLWSASRHPNCCARGHRHIARCAASAQPLGRIAIAVEPSTTVASFAAVSSLEVCPTPALRLGCCEDLSRLTGRCRTNLNYCGRSPSSGQSDETCKAVGWSCDTSLASDADRMSAGQESEPALATQRSQWWFSVGTTDPSWNLTFAGAANQSRRRRSFASAERTGFRTLSGCRGTLKGLEESGLSRRALTEMGPRYAVRHSRSRKHGPRTFPPPRFRSSPCP